MADHLGGSDLTVRVVSADDGATLSAVVGLADGSRHTLGFLPAKVFAEAAAEGRLLSAVQDGQVVGYTLYRLPRRHISLTHLCVRPESRGHGIASRLVDAISARHPDRLGIQAKCRHDYGLADLWLHLGFTARSEVPGRSHDAKPLVVWWRDHGHPNLFTPWIEPTLSAAIDFNVFRDIHDAVRRAGSDESRSLVADHLTGLLELVITDELVRAVDRVHDTRTRGQYRSGTNSYRHVRCQPDAADRIAEQLIAVARERDRQFPKDHADSSDVRHLAEVAAAEVRVFITRDEALIQRFSRFARETLAVRVLRPADVITHLDELMNAQEYRPGDLLGTAIQRARATATDDLLVFLGRSEGERRTDFQATLRRLALGGLERWIIRDDNGVFLACYAYRVTGGQLVVELLRIPAHALGPTLTRQLLFLLRRVARDNGCTVVRLADPHSGPRVTMAARLDGFLDAGPTLSRSWSTAAQPPTPSKSQPYQPPRPPAYGSP
jgi:GNAT superfamily N-acetyltransferase